MKLQTNVPVTIDVKYVSGGTGQYGDYINIKGSVNGQDETLKYLKAWMTDRLIQAGVLATAEYTEKEIEGTDKYEAFTVREYDVVDSGPITILKKETADGIRWTVERADGYSYDEPPAAVKQEAKAVERALPTTKADKRKAIAEDYRWAWETAKEVWGPMNDEAIVAAAATLFIRLRK